MGFKKYKPILEVTLLAIPLFIAHKVIFGISGSQKAIETFHYTLEQLYAFFLAASILIVFILIKIREKNLDNVGNVFMLLTCLKMAIAYLVLRPILQNVYPSQHSEKINFLIVFMLFLAIETLISVRILNNKQ